MSFVRDSCPVLEAPTILPILAVTLLAILADSCLTKVRSFAIASTIHYGILTGQTILKSSVGVSPILPDRTDRDSF